jgi:hypothetical protein
MPDAADGGNPVTELMGDARVAVAQIEFFTGHVTSVKSARFPRGRASSISRCLSLAVSLIAEKYRDGNVSVVLLDPRERYN